MIFSCAWPLIDILERQFNRIRNQPRDMPLHRSMRGFSGRSKWRKKNCLGCVPLSLWRTRYREVQGKEMLFTCLPLLLPGEWIYSVVLLLLQLLFLWLPFFTNTRPLLLQLSNTDWRPSALQESSRPPVPALGSWGTQLHGLSSSLLLRHTWAGYFYVVLT